MNRKLYIILVLALFVLPAAAQLKEGLNSSTIRISPAGTQPEQSVNAVIWLPKAYTPSKKYPLLIYSHGPAPAGASPDQPFEDGLPDVLRNGFTPPFDCIIICPGEDPKKAAETRTPLPEWLPGILEDAHARFPIDTNRIYLAGASTGGFLCLGSQLNLSPHFGSHFAAICIISGSPREADLSHIDWWVNNSTPVWFIVGSGDQALVRENVSLARDLNTRLRGLATLSIHPGSGLDSWADVFYGNFKDGRLGFWDWLGQNRARTTPSGSRQTPLSANRKILLRARDGQVYCTNVESEYGPQPGDTLVVPHHLISFLLRNFKGTKEKPIVIIPEDSSYIGGYGPYSAVISDARYFKVTGFHIDGKRQSNLGMAIASQTTDYEISRCTIRNTAAIGLCAKQDPDSSWPGGSWPGFSIRNVSIHDITVRNTGTEGLYLGYTFDVVKPLAPPLVNLQVYNISVDSTGWDGLQLSNCQQVLLHHISIRHYGLKNEKGQQAGLLLGGMVTLKDKASDIRVSGGTGAGLQIFGRGTMSFNKIRLSNVGMSPGENAIFINDYYDLGYHLPTLAVSFNDVAIDGSSGSALEAVNGNGTMRTGQISNFTFKNTRTGIHTPSPSPFTIK